MTKAYLGGGCFWCLEAVYQRVKGVERVVSGYAGGNTENPTYKDVGGGNTGHAEVVEVTYDENLVDFKTLLDIFFTIHDPTTPNRQGNDVGTQYRSIILATDDQQKAVASKYLQKEATDLWGKGVVTELVGLEKFYPAEDYHQDYYNQNSTAGYCQFVINPKIAKFSEKFQHLLK